MDCCTCKTSGHKSQNVKIQFWVNHSGTNRNRCTQRLVILQAQTYEPNESPSLSKNEVQSCTTKSTPNLQQGIRRHQTPPRSRNLRWSGKTRDIAVSCGVKILTDNYFVLSQYTHLSDRQTDRRTDGQNCDSNSVRCITCSHTVETITSLPKVIWEEGRVAAL